MFKIHIPVLQNSKSNDQSHTESAKGFSLALLFTLLLVTLTLFPCGAQPTTNITVDAGWVSLSDRGELGLWLEEDAEALLLVMHEICYYYQTCYESLSVPDHVASLLTCCVPCDCSDDCFAIGNCCRDNNDEPEEARMITGNGETCIATPPETSYLMVSTCHPEYAGKAAVKCLNPHPASLHELTPVNSLDTNITYRNVYCSRCNYETGVVLPWTTKAVCLSYVPVSNVESLESVFLDGGCNFTVEPNGASKKCYQRSSPAECFGGEYEAMCNTVPGGRTYINKMTDTLCQGCGLPFQDACRNISSYFIESSFEAILNIGTVADEKNDSGPRRDDDSNSRLNVNECPEGETFVNEKKTCLRLLCPPSQITETAREVHCIDPFFKIEGLCLDTRLSVTISTDGTSTPRTERLALEAADKLFPFTLDTPLFLLIPPTILDYRANRQQVVYTVQAVESISAFANVFTQYQLFRDRLDSLTPSSGVRVELGTAGLSYIPQPLEEVGYLAYADTDNLTNFGCLRMIAVSDLQFCRSVIFSAEEYVIQGDALVMKEGPVFQSYEHVLRSSRDGNNSHVQVCLETYLSRLGSSASRSSGIGVLIVYIASLVSASL